jgi:hypothetical protein
MRRGVCSEVWLLQAVLLKIADKPFSLLESLAGRVKDQGLFERTGDISSNTMDGKVCSLLDAL